MRRTAVATMCAASISHQGLHGTRGSEVQDRQNRAAVDFGAMDAFVPTVRTGDPAPMKSRAREALEGHLMAFAAEHSRRSGTPVDLA
jgi:hypothetical protein